MLEASHSPRECGDLLGIRVVLWSRRLHSRCYQGLRRSLFSGVILKIFDAGLLCPQLFNHAGYQQLFQYGIDSGTMVSEKAN